ncbi:MAG TPA: pyrimidine dimer DNA glycosylase/endonuclease V [Burkholderiaceae bacterium]|nr:pyrimidine dimer DNA glycosylase/endonuclease V [Burkholderiaceae bacterium]
MTRINADLPPRLLTDQHLFAEYREMRRIPKSLVKSMGGGSTRELAARIPPVFCLGRGHVTFFYDKGLFLTARHALLRTELIARGYRLNDDGVFDNLGVYLRHPEFLGDASFRFDAAARLLVVERIAERIRDKPHIYTLDRSPIVPDQYYAALVSAALAR